MGCNHSSKIKINDKNSTLIASPSAMVHVLKDKIAKEEFERPSNHSASNSSHIRKAVELQLNSLNQPTEMNLTKDELDNFQRTELQERLFLNLPTNNQDYYVETGRLTGSARNHHGGKSSSKINGVKIYKSDLTDTSRTAFVITTQNYNLYQDGI